MYNAQVAATSRRVSIASFAKESSFGSSICNDIHETVSEEAIAFVCVEMLLILIVPWGISSRSHSRVRAVVHTRGQIS
jgi:hypothetical protein